jgi:MFS family permease
MPESISSAKTCSTTPTEWLLARIAGPDRAAAIMGDLTEMAATRGRLWFWLAYARTVVELGWRVPFSFVLGCSIFSFIFWLSSFWRRVWLLHALRLGQPYMMLHMSPYLWLFLYNVTIPLWFTAPFAVARYGVHDRFVRLTLLFTLAMTCALLYPHPITLLFVAITLCAIAVSLFSEQWRRPVFVFAATVGTGTTAYLVMSQAVFLGFWYFGQQHHRHPFDGGFAAPHRIFWIAMWAIALSSMFILTFVCSRMHRRLLEHSTSANLTIA